LYRCQALFAKTLPQVRPDISHPRHSPPSPARPDRQRQAVIAASLAQAGASQEAVGGGDADAAGDMKLDFHGAAMRRPAKRGKRRDYSTTTAPG